MTTSVSVLNTISAPVLRSEIEQQALTEYPIPFTLLRVHDAMHTTLPGTAANDDAALITGTPGTDAPTVQGVDFGGTSTDEKFAFIYPLPLEYDAGNDVLVRVRGAMVTAISDGTATVDVEAWKFDGNGAVGSDLCTTPAQSINSLTPANKDFVISAAALSPGDVLVIRVSFAGSDVGNLAVMIPEIQKLAMLLDTRG